MVIVKEEEEDYILDSDKEIGLIPDSPVLNPSSRIGYFFFFGHLLLSTLVYS